MREIRTSGSVGARGGNALGYPTTNCDASGNRDPEVAAAPPPRREAGGNPAVGALDRGPPPPPHDGLEAVPRQARIGPRRPVPRATRRDRRAGRRGRPRPAPRPPGQAPRRREEARKISRPAKPDHVPAAVRRAVWSRDEARCKWPLDAGGTCDSTLRLEIDHVVPRGRGGPSTIEICRSLRRSTTLSPLARSTATNGWIASRAEEGRAPRHVPVAREPAAAWGWLPHPSPGKLLLVPVSGQREVGRGSGVDANSHGLSVVPPVGETGGADGRPVLGGDLAGANLARPPFQFRDPGLGGVRVGAFIETQQELVGDAGRAPGPGSARAVERTSVVSRGIGRHINAGPAVHRPGAITCAGIVIFHRLADRPRGGGTPALSRLRFAMARRTAADSGRSSARRNRYPESSWSHTSAEVPSAAESSRAVSAVMCLLLEFIADGLRRPRDRPHGPPCGRKGFPGHQGFAQSPLRHTIPVAANRQQYLIQDCLAVHNCRA